MGALGGIIHGGADRESVMMDTCQGSGSQSERRREERLKRAEPVDSWNNPPPEALREKMKK